MTPLRQKMIDTMLVRGFSARTQRSYLDAVAQLARHYRRSPETLSRAQLQAYFLYLVKDRQLSPATCRLYLNAIRFLYLRVLDWPEVELTLNAPKRPQRIPELLSRGEVARVLAAPGNFKHRVLLTTCYGCGLRVSELVALQVRDIDGERSLLRVTQGKGGKDRLVILPVTLLRLLRRYWRILHPGAALFFGRDPLAPMSIETAQRVFQAAKQQSGIDKVGGIHSLRHAYATHQLAAGMPLHQLKQQLGHNDLHSTMRYLHWVPQYTEGQGLDLVAGLGVDRD